MEVYRLAREKFADVLSGRGAAISGARWNPKGLELIYTATNRSLAMAEVAVHLSLATMPGDYVMLTIFIPDDVAVKHISGKDLPVDWNAFPHLTSTQVTGEQFVMENKYCLLKVPSAVTQGDYNILINPMHPDFSRIKIIDKVKFPFDKRIFRDDK